MLRPVIVFSAHARSRMMLRGIDEELVRIILGGAARVPESAPAGAAKRWRYASRISGRLITVLVAEKQETLVVITVF